MALTETTTYGTLSTAIEGTATTTPNDSVTVTTASAAEILEVYVSAGDTVEAGDLLYVQDDAQLDEEIETYQDEIAELEEELDGYYDQLADLHPLSSDQRLHHQLHRQGGHLRPGGHGH